MTMADRGHHRERRQSSRSQTDTLFSKPANLFVAGFIGSPGMNFMSTHVEAGSITLFGQHFAAHSRWRWRGDRRQSVRNTCRSGRVPSPSPCGRHWSRASDRRNTSISIRANTHTARPWEMRTRQGPDCPASAHCGPFVKGRAAALL
ncbi:hypothetical protein F2981_33300 (plasmid) [Sinorhizobium meliloti]|nr:hypothetical protein [Sinorhizobium meliloti]